MPVENDFAEIFSLIEQARRRAYQSVNTQLIDLYWTIGKFVRRKIDAEGWGKGTVKQLSVYIQRRSPGIRGFSPQNIWRMRQFYDSYCDEPKLSTLLRGLSWSANLHILSHSRQPEEREFYLRMATKNGWDVREVARQIHGSLFERAVLTPPKISTALRDLHPVSQDQFKDAYLLEFLELPSNHSEADLHRSLLGNLGHFLAELGRDFCFIGSEYPVQVGDQDFAIDLLFFHRGLSSLVAIELKVGQFQPEHLGKLNFYLEALDRDVKKDHERPSIGLLLCASKNNEVVEYALSRSLSPALIAEYKTLLPDKKLLQDKLHAFYQLAESAAALAHGPKRGSHVS